MVVSIRLPKREDTKEILALEHATHKELGSDLSMNGEDLLEWVGRGRTRLYIAESNSVLVGYLMVDASNDEETVVHRLTVAAKVRRQGIGLSLLERAKIVAKKAKAKTLAIYAYEDDAEMHKFLRRYELKPEVIRRHYGANSAWKFTMRLENIGR